MHRLTALLFFAVLGIIGVPAAYATDPTTIVEQPIEFPHDRHAGDMGINCMYCHTYARRSIVSGIPPLAKCIGCHQNIESVKDKPRIKKLFEDAGLMNFVDFRETVRGKTTQDLREYAAKLAEFGAQVSEAEILPSCDVVSDYLTTIAPPGARVFVVGEAALAQSLQARGFVVSENLENVLRLNVKRLQAFAADHPHQLMERFAQAVADILMGEFGAPWVKVRVAKLAPIAGVKELGIAIERKRG